MPNENKFTQGVNPLCPNDNLWTARDEQSSEDEVNEFLYALIRLIKPQFVLETGCYLGDGTLNIARALKENGIGKMITCDILANRVAKVDKIIDEEHLKDITQTVVMTGVELIKQCGSLIDFAFIDSGPEGAVREAEIEALLPFLQSGQMFLLHDTAPQYEQINMVAWKFARYPSLTQVYFNTPRGLTLFMKK